MEGFRIKWLGFAPSFLKGRQNPSMSGGGWTCCCPDSQGAKRKCDPNRPWRFFSRGKASQVTWDFTQCCHHWWIDPQGICFWQSLGMKGSFHLLTTSFLQGKFTGKRRYTWNVMAWKECYGQHQIQGALLELGELECFDTSAFCPIF